MAVTTLPSSGKTDNKPKEYSDVLPKELELSAVQTEAQYYAMMARIEDAKKPKKSEQGE